MSHGILSYLVLMLTFCIGPSVHAARLIVDSRHSRLGFSVKHLMMTEITGAVNLFSGTIMTANPYDFNERDSVEFVAESLTIDSNDNERDKMLRSPAFLDVLKFPTMRFKGSQMKRLSKGEHLIQGDLTIRGITRPFEMKTKFLGRNRLEGVERVAYRGVGKINRSAFGMTWNQVLESGGLLVDDVVEIHAELEFELR